MEGVALILSGLRYSVVSALFLSCLEKTSHRHWSESGPARAVKLFVTTQTSPIKAYCQVTDVSDKSDVLGHDVQLVYATLCAVTLKYLKLALQRGSRAGPGGKMFDSEE